METWGEKRMRNGIFIGRVAMLGMAFSAEAAVKINFQPATDAVPEGWVADCGAEYTKAHGG